MDINKVGRCLGKLPSKEAKKKVLCNQPCSTFERVNSTFSMSIMQPPRLSM
ncbi:uncharacterized protein HKW66_Vig0241510 [Vigna angularis]|uniref:Uncharacterized protein n=1 Tax=Phaseolus angularis TaxID=3914 RepID=A0A8T0JKR8_PHAAN|nr:uncharacterized protein HKW66_Vig0241510 [Vigna angularis]